MQEKKYEFPVKFQNNLRIGKEKGAGLCPADKNPSLYAFYRIAASKRRLRRIHCDNTAFAIRIRICLAHDAAQRARDIIDQNLIIQNRFIL